MHNIHLVGIQNQPDRFNIRSSLAVVGLFGVILIVSYFNELARAGLLSRDQTKYRVPYDQNGHVVKRTTHDDVILQKGGDIHRLDINLKPLHSALRSSANNRSDKAGGEEINIKVHIGKNTSYSVKNGTDQVRIYQHQNTVENLFLGLRNFRENVTWNETFSLDDKDKLKSTIYKERERTSPFNSTMVLLYQHEPGGYALRDCLIRAAYDKHLQINKVPLNAIYRNEWEALSSKQKSKFQVLFGGLSFGACEGIPHSCSYSTFVTHPIDRILQVYATCKNNISKAMCHLNHLNMQNTTVYEFVQREGNNLFQKLLYYSRHCKLVGDDELCIHDNKAFFLLNAKERSAYLESVLENLPKWFRTVGLVQHWRQSIALIDFTYGLNFTSCFGKVYRDMLPAPKHDKKFKRTRDLYSFVQSKLLIDGKPYKQVREELLNDTKVTKLLHPDLAIYDRLEQLFEEQLAVYKRSKIILARKGANNPNKIAFNNTTPSVSPPLSATTLPSAVGAIRNSAKSNVLRYPQKSPHDKKIKNMPDSKIDANHISYHTTQIVADVKAHNKPVTRKHKQSRKFDHVRKKKNTKITRVTTLPTKRSKKDKRGGGI